MDKVPIENARLLEQTDRFAKLLYLATRVAGAAAATLEIDELLTDTARFIGDFFGLYHVAIFVLDKGGEYAELQVSHSQVDHEILKQVHNLRVDLQGIVGHVIDTGQHYIAPEVSHDKFYLINPALPDTRFEAAFPLKARGQLIGVLDIQNREKVDLAAEEIATLQLIADQLAYVINNTQLFQEASERFNEVETLRRVAVSLTGTSEAEQIFEIVVKAALELTGTDEGSLLFWDSQREEFTHALQTERDSTVREYIANAGTTKGQIDNARKIIDTRQLIAVYDAPLEYEFGPIFINKGLRSSLGAPLMISEKVFGVLSVLGYQPRNFSERDIKLFEALAGQAAVAIDRARQSEGIRKTMGYVGSHTAVDWMRMVSTSWGHSIRREVGTTLGRVALLRHLLNEERLPPEVQGELRQLENTIRNIRDIPIVAPLSYGDSVEAVHINELVKKYLERRWQHVRYKPIKLQFKLQPDLDDQVSIWAEKGWLRRGLEILIDNAVEAMTNSYNPEQQITVSTRIVRDMVEISIRDTGPGIPKDVQAKLFREPIPKLGGSRGGGIGLLVAQTIFQTYLGDIRVSSIVGKGTDVIISLPVRFKEQAT